MWAQVSAGHLLNCGSAVCADCAHIYMGPAGSQLPVSHQKKGPERLFRGRHPSTPGTAPGPALTATDTHTQHTTAHNGTYTTDSDPAHVPAAEALRQARTHGPWTRMDGPFPRSNSWNFHFISKGVTMSCVAGPENPTAHSGTAAEEHTPQAHSTPHLINNRSTNNIPITLIPHQSTFLRILHMKCHQLNCTYNCRFITTPTQHELHTNLNHTAETTPLLDVSNTWNLSSSNPCFTQQFISISIFAY